MLTGCDCCVALGASGVVAGSGAGVVCVEDDVEGPVAVVLDAPVGPHCFETAPWGQRFGERGVVNARPDLAFGRPLGFDAPKGGEAGEARRAGRGGDDAGLAPFLAIVSGLGLLMKGQGAACVSGLERLDGAAVERPVVGLELQGVVTASGAHGPGHGRMAVQGVGGDRATPQRHGFQRRQGRGDLVAAGRMAGGEGQARFGVPDADHERRHEGAAPLVSAPQALAVHRHHAARRSNSERFAQSVHEPCEDAGHLLRVEQAEHPAEAVVARGPVRKLDDFRQTVFVGRGEIGDVHATPRPAQSRSQGDEQHCRQIVPRIQVPRVANLPEYRNQRRHHRLRSNREAPSESISTRRARAFTQTRFPYLLWGRAGVGGRADLDDYRMRRCARLSRRTARPPSLILPHKGGGDASERSSRKLNSRRP